MIPGMIPPRNSFPVEMPRIPAITTMGILGGMTIPIVEEMAVTATVSFLLYPFFTICGIIIPLTPAVSATAEPEIPAKIILDNTFTWARPPVKRPTME